MEEWRTIAEFPDYEVSSLGDVKRVRCSNKGFIGVHPKPRTSHGYRAVHLKHGPIRKWKFVHRLVIEAFVAPRPSEKHFVAHNNGVRHDNRPENLRWATPKENTADRYKHGTVRYGEEAPSSRLNVQVVRQIRELHSSGMPSRKVAKHFGVCQRTVLLVSSRRTWAHVDA